MNKQLKVYFITVEVEAKIHEMLIFAPDKKTAKEHGIAQAGDTIRFPDDNRLVKAKRVRISSGFIKKLYAQTTIFQAVERA